MTDRTEARRRALRRTMGRELLAAVAAYEREQTVDGEVVGELALFPGWVRKALELAGAALLGLNVATLSMFIVFYVVNKVLHVSL